MWKSPYSVGSGAVATRSIGCDDRTVDDRVWQPLAACGSAGEAVRRDLPAERSPHLRERLANAGDPMGRRHLDRTGGVPAVACRSGRSLDAAPAPRRIGLALDRPRRWPL